jgi:hypothetical protein
LSNEVNVDELLKRILEEEEFVKSQTLNYEEYLPEFIAKAKELGADESGKDFERAFKKVVKSKPSYLERPKSRPK